MKCRLSSLLAMVVLLLVGLGHRPVSLTAAEFDADKLAQVRAEMQKFVDKKYVAGVVTVVGTKEGIARTDAVGFQSVSPAKEMPQNALFRIASMTKPITAIGVVILQEEGKLSIDDPVEKHLPEFKGQMMIAERGKGTLALKNPSRPITIKDLLTHTSGLPGGYPVGIADLYNRRHLTLAESVYVSSQRPLDFEPGSKWAYCNAGIDTLGRIIEVCSGDSYEGFLTKRVFTPLGMVDTTPYPNDEQLTRVATLYESKDGMLTEPAKPLIGPTKTAKHPIPAGGLYSTGADLAKLYQAMLNRGQLNGKRILSDSSVALMSRLHTGDLQAGFGKGMGFGLGWAVVRQPTGATSMLSEGTFGHGGAFGTQGWIDPHQGVFCILLIQRTGTPGGDGSDIRHEFQKAAFNALKK